MEIMYSAPVFNAWFTFWSAMAREIDSNFTAKLPLLELENPQHFIAAIVDPPAAFGKPEPQRALVILSDRDFGGR